MQSRTNKQPHKFLFRVGDGVSMRIEPGRYPKKLMIIERGQVETLTHNEQYYLVRTADMEVYRVLEAELKSNNNH